MLKRIWKATVALFSGQALTIAVQLLLVPLFLKSWSLVSYGEWLALSSFVKNLSNLSFGMNMAATNRMTQAYALEDISTYKRTQHTAIVLFLIVAAIGTAMLGLAVLFLPIPRWIGIREMTSTEAAWVTGLLGMQVMWTFPLNLMIDTYHTTGNLATSQWAKNGRQLLQSALTAAALFLGCSFQIIAALQLFSLVLIAGLVLWHLWRRFPNLMPGISQAGLSEAKSLFKPSSRFFLITLSQTISEQGGVVVISSILGGASVALFVTSRTLVNLIRQFVGMLGKAFWPDLTMAHKRNEYGRLGKMYRLITGISIAITVAYAAALWAYGSEIIKVWTSSSLTSDQTLLALLLVHRTLQSVWLTSSLIQATTNQNRVLAKAYLASSIIGLLTSILLINWLGVWAVPIGFIVGESLACYHFVIQDSCRIVQTKYASFASRLWSTTFLISSIVVLIVWSVSKTIAFAYPGRWIITGFAALTTAATLTWLLWLNKEDRLTYRVIILKLKQRFLGPSQGLTQVR